MAQSAGGRGTEIISYDLKLDVDFRKAFVKGEETVTVKGASSPFSLDCSSLDVGSVKVDGKGVKFRHDKKRSKLVIPGVTKKQSRVEIDYTKQVSDEVIFGLYKSKYGKDYILATDLEPAEARSVFPCVDEPAYKAVFRLEITTDSGLKVIANTQASRIEDLGGGRTRHVFEKTPRMSTYLFFFAIGDMEETRTQSGGVEVITATRPGQARNSDLALRMVAGSVRDFASYYGVPYPLKKLHLVALPEYHTGAMENWGAISSRESYALVTEGAAFRQKNRGAMSMVHEVAHQWFGDLVTMKWWDDLWLNESFATFMGYKMTDRLRPEWDTMSIFLMDETLAALNLDAVRTTHPVQAHVRKVEEAMHMFDAVSYNKGASILRMLESYVGEDTFRKGVSDYLRKFSFSNASGKDLWDSLGRASSLPVTKVAREWLTRPGFPVVEVRSAGKKVRLSQKRFLITGSVRAAPWPITTNITIGGEARKLFFDKVSMTLDVDHGSDILLNQGRMSFHVTLYDKKGYHRLAERFATLSPHDRGGLINDLFLFLQAGEVDPNEYFRFIGLCGGTPDSVTVQVAAGQLRLLNAIAWDSPGLRAVYPKFYPRLLARIGEEPKPGEPEYLGAAREELTSQYVEVDEAYAAKLAQKFDHYLELDPNLRGAVASAYAITYGERAKGPLIQMVKTMQGEVDRAKIYGALCSFKDPSLVEETLDLGMSGEVSRSDSAYPMIFGALNTGARKVYWKWLTKHYDAIYEMYGGSQQFYLYMMRLLPVCGVGREAEVKRFLSGRRMKQGGSSLIRAMEGLEINSALRRRLLAKGPRS
ncbi:MAG: M1 family metallopeptidase [Nitrososphaerota archaeon]|nr:M1 family metallopeptidase [Nitrososphaerota archaeon]MDG6941665.1 M1 family metallopeptidase [Nitrososphaerota archaeon]MDG6947161.1 M1 family metallopeptidase [Nitrososphaerota archaeon]MDG6951261.1 M1 family metallopeptidase [Nitrososphaerota archaeon]